PRAGAPSPDGTAPAPAEPLVTALARECDRHFASRLPEEQMLHERRGPGKRNAHRGGAAVDRLDEVGDLEPDRVVRGPHELRDAARVRRLGGRVLAGPGGGRRRGG